MSHQDRYGVRSRLNSAYLSQSLQWLLSNVEWNSIQFRDDCSWSPRLLTAAALLWVWSNERTLNERFFVARRLVGHLFCQEDTLAYSYQAFVKLLRRWTSHLVSLMQAAFRKRMQEKLSQQWTSCGWAVFGVDGSRMELPRTKSHMAVYSPSKNRPGKRKRSRPRRPTNPAYARMALIPHLWVTTMFHVGTGLPWDWRTGPSDSSERAHALEMLSSLPPKSLLTADAGFIGYDFARQIVDGGRELLLRVGANVRLMRKLGWAREYSGIVYFWPEKAMRSKQPPLVLRLVVVQGARHPIYLLTSILSRTALSDQQVSELYKGRWGIELFYRHLKQTFERRKLRSNRAENASVELEWSLIGIWGLGLCVAVEIASVSLSLSRMSIAGTLKIFRRLIRDYLHPAPSGTNLRELLQTPLIDIYIRKNKQSRDYPRKRTHRLIGAPLIYDATPNIVQYARLLQAELKKG